jgi:hypothetical protein
VSEYASTFDPAGRRVLLEHDRWDEIVRRYPELGPLQDDVMRAVARPDFVTADPEADRQHYWRQSVGPSRWLRVVVDVRAGLAQVISASPEAADPPDWPGGLSP